MCKHYILKNLICLVKQPKLPAGVFVKCKTVLQHKMQQKPLDSDQSQTEYPQSQTDTCTKMLVIKKRKVQNKI